MAGHNEPRTTRDAPQLHKFARASRAAAAYEETERVLA